jgi:3-methyladenine DNA glycosylase AlkD
VGRTDLPLDDLRSRLEARAVPAKKEWWERYLKGAVPFLGVPMGDIRAAVVEWQAEHELSPSRLRRASLAMLALPSGEEKLAGILTMQVLLLPADELRGERDLGGIAVAFDRGHVADWNTCDWLCVRVLGPLIEREGRSTAEAVGAWTRAPGLWRRRAGVVAFVNLASRGDDAVPGLVDTVLAGCADLVRDPERFAQTGVGWVLRDLSDGEPDRVFAFVTAHRDTMSREAIRMAASRLPDDRRSALGLTGPRRRR